MGCCSYAGIMHPLCGATRSVRHTFRGELGPASRYNPLGPVLAAGTLALLALAAALEIRQQARADLLMSVS